MSRRPRNFRQAADNFFTNWDTSDASFLEKVRLTIRNNARKVSTGRSCCGHHGEPGC